MDQLPRAAAVLLARLLVPAGLPPKLAAVRKDVADVVGELSDPAWSAAVSAATGTGFAASVAVPGKATKVGAKPKPVSLRLTGEGRTAARDRLGALADHRTLTPAKVAGHWQWADPKPSASAVLLTRLYVPSEKPPTHAAARKSVVAVVGPLDDEGWARAVASLVSAGYIAPDAAAPVAAASASVALTDAGRSAVAGWVGLSDVPAGLTWAAVRDKWLPAVTVPAEDRAAFADDKRVIGLLLGRLFDVGPAGSVDEAIQAAVCRDLGHPDLRRIDALVASVIGRRLDKTLPPLTQKDLDKQVPAAALDVPAASPKAVRAAALKRWASAGPAPADDLPSFAAAVNRAAAASTSGRFGNDKVFISHVHRQLADGSSLEAFKGRLVEANRAGLVSLARADLVAAMNPADVRASEVRYLTAEFHFVRIEKGREP